ncbi:hypothetical protein [Herbaspirillum sp. RV1423]|uniref:hypothetical protein n=1 Tax=Herbaspirillum sp. RV1423 TaxID=1443993 RepID=UPI0004BBA0F7|nr:hypothetical protein [Herbaspirillum sp. RV1423]
MLLAFLFPLQLFAGTLEPMASEASGHAAIVFHDGAGMPALQAVEEVVNAAADSQPESEPFKVQADLEDQTLPAPFATLPLDWRPFPHLYPCVNGGTSAFIDLLRPPPVV